MSDLSENAFCKVSEVLWWIIFFYVGMAFSHGTKTSVIMKMPNLFLFFHIMKMYYWLSSLVEIWLVFFTHTHTQRERETHMYYT